MNKLVGMVVFGLVAVAGCASAESEEEPMETSQAEIRNAGSTECQLGDGLYCGGNGVNGGDRTLYRCSGGTVSAVESCSNGCEWMAAGQNDQCRAGASTSSSGSAPSGPIQVISLKKGNWASCGSDGECASNRCGCNGGSKLQCLPTAAYPKTCRLILKKLNWASCGSDSECGSNRCGCNGGTQMQCLPTAAYPKTCR